MTPTGYIVRTAPLTNDHRVGYLFVAGPEPVVDALVPASATLGSPSFTLHVRGEGFTPSSVIEWNGGAEPTTFIDDTHLTTEVNMATATVAGPIPVAVRVENYLRSNALDFDLLAP